MLTPALVLDPQILHANVARMASAVGVALRPHFKTSKLIEVARLQAAAGAVGFTAATAAEVAALLEAGLTDVFWAHAPVGAKAALAADFNRRGRVAVGLDSAELADALSAAAVSAGVTVPVRIEVDTGLGRTGVLPQAAPRLASAVAALPGLQLEGVYTHEGQLYRVLEGADALRSAGRAAAEVLVGVADALRASGIEVGVVSVGSTPGWDSASAVPGVTEARPGTYVFGDANQVRLASTTLQQCALTVHASVVSTPRPGEAVIDAGVKAMSADPSNVGSTFGLVLTTDGRVRDDLEFSRAYEEHGLLTGPGTAGLAIGDTVRILPNHACTTLNMWGTVLVGDEAWHPVARH